MSALRRQFRREIRAKGSNYTHTPQVGSPTTPIKAVIVDPRNEDQSLINSLGSEVRILRTLDLPVIAQFDTLTDPTGAVFSVGTRHAITVGDRIAGQNVYVVTT